MIFPGSVASIRSPIPLKSTSVPTGFLLALRHSNQSLHEFWMPSNCKLLFATSFMTLSSATIEPCTLPRNTTHSFCARRPKVQYTTMAKDGSTLGNQQVKPVANCTLALWHSCSPGTQSFGKVGPAHEKRGATKEIDLYHTKHSQAPCCRVSYMFT